MGGESAFVQLGHDLWMQKLIWGQIVDVDDDYLLDTNFKISGVLSQSVERSVMPVFISPPYLEQQLVSSERGGGGGCQKKSDACPLFCVGGSKCKKDETIPKIGL